MRIDNRKIVVQRSVELKIVLIVIAETLLINLRQDMISTESVFQQKHIIFHKPHNSSSSL